MDGTDFIPMLLLVFFGGMVIGVAMGVGIPDTSRDLDIALDIMSCEQLVEYDYQVDESRRASRVLIDKECYT